MTRVKLGHLTAAVILSLLFHFQEVGAIVIGSPTVTLPGPTGATLTGITIRYIELEFLGVNKPIDAYLGVPFAEPPVGDLRFEDPVPYEIQGNYNATEDRDMCYQVNPLSNLPDPFPELGRQVSEDCLHLGIYTPSPKPSSPTPVMVWIHGGGNLVGSGSANLYEPLPMVALSDIIVVTINYRLGVLGFMTTGDDVATGNYGLMDQLLALQWVQNNIAAFGGDPQRVTIAGESAGGSGVSTHTLSPLSRGLFHQTIMQSGNAVCPWASATMEEAAVHHRALAASMGCSTEDSQAMVNCLRGVDAEVLIDQQTAYDGGFLSSPVIDGHLLPDDPVEMVKRRQFQVLPTLMGTNEEEMSWRGIFFDFPNTVTQRPTMNISYFRNLLSVHSWHNLTPEESAAIEQQYVDWSVTDNSTADQLDSFIRMDTDQTFACPTEYLARELEAAGAEIYRYEMIHDPAWSVYAGLPTWTGATHMEDIPFLFAWGLNPTLKPIVQQTDEEKTMSVEFMRYWTNFVKSGNPNEPMTSETYPAWPRYSMPEQQYKKLSLNMTNDRAMRAAGCSFWLNFMPKLNLQTAPIEEIYEDWQKQYEKWRDTDMPNWTTEFDEYKENNRCPAPSP